MPSPPRCAVGEHRPRDWGCGLRERICLSAALGAGATNWSCFPASEVVPSFRGSLGGRDRPLARGLCAPMVPRDGPPFPASCAFADAAIPRIAVAAIPRGSADGARHPPDCVDGHHRRGVKRTAFDRHGEAASRTSTTSTAPDGDHDASASGRARRGLSAKRGDLGSAWDRRCGLRPSAHRRAVLERGEPIARRSRARLTGSCSCLMQRSADELDLFTGFA